MTATAWAIVAVLSGMREASKDDYEACTAFNRTCDDALTHLQQQIAALRFSTAR